MLKSERPGPSNSPPPVKKSFKAIILEDGEIEDSFNKRMNFGNSKQEDSIATIQENVGDESGDISTSDEEKNKQIMKQQKRRRKKSEDKKLKERKSRHKKRKSESISDGNASPPSVKKKISKRSFEDKQRRERRISKMELEEKTASTFAGDDSTLEQFEEKRSKSLRKRAKGSQNPKSKRTSCAVHCKSDLVTSSSSNSDSCYSDLETHLKKGHECPPSGAIRNESDCNAMSQCGMKRRRGRRFQDPIQCPTNAGNTRLPNVNYMVISPSDRKLNDGKEKPFESPRHPFESPCHMCPDQQHNRMLPDFLPRDPRRKFQFTCQSERDTNQMWTQNCPNNSNHLQRIDPYRMPGSNPFSASPEKSLIRPFHSGLGPPNANPNCFHDRPMSRRGIHPSHLEGPCRPPMDLQQKLEAKMANDRQMSPCVHPPYPPPIPSGLLNQGHMETSSMCSIPIQRPALIGNLIPPPGFVRPNHRRPMLMPHPPPMQGPMQPVLPPVMPPWIPPPLMLQQQMKGVGHPPHWLNKMNNFRMNPRLPERENEIKNETKGDYIQGVKPDQNNGLNTEIESSPNSVRSLMDLVTKHRQAASASVDPSYLNKVANAVKDNPARLDPRIAKQLQLSSNPPQTPIKRKGEGEGPIRLILKRKINANDLRKEPLVIPFSTGSNIKEPRADPRAEQSRLLRKEKQLFSASLPLFGKTVSAPRTTKKLPFQSSPCQKTSGIPRTEASKPSDPRVTRHNPKTGFDTPASITVQPPSPVSQSPIVTSSVFASKPVALLSKSFPCGLPSIDLELPLIQEESSKSALSSPLKHSSGDMPKLPKLTKTESLTFENFNKQPGFAADAKTSLREAKKHSSKSPAGLQKRKDYSESDDVILNTGCFVDENTQSLPDQDSSQKTLRLPKLMPAPRCAVEVRGTVEKLAKGQNG